MASYQHVTGENKNKEEKEEVSLLLHLAQVLKDSRETVVVHGQPGHGKSSAMRMLVHASLAAHEPGDEPPTLLMLEFKNLGQLNRNELTILRERYPFIHSESFFHDRNTLLILDGMDERQVTENADSDLKGFLQLMMAVAQRVNQRQGSRLNLVVTGRSQFFHGVRSAFQHYHAYELMDFDQERVERWLAKFNQQKNLSDPWSYQKLKDCKFGELLGQPILLTLVGLLISDPVQSQLVQAMGTVNRAQVYETIIKWTYQKRWHKDRKSPEMEEQAFFDLLQAVAFCMFCRGSEIITLRDLKKDLERHQGLLNIEIPKSDRLEKLCDDLAISFFFTGKEDKAFSFIHKSFGDFLLVRAMFSALKRLASLPLRHRVADMYLLLGARPLTVEGHWFFMLETAKNAQDQSQTMVPTLLEFLQSAQSHRYLLQHGKDLGENPVATEVSLLSGALTWLVVCNLAQDQPSLLEIFRKENEFSRYLALLNAAPIATVCDFSYLELQVSNLYHANLKGVNLANACLRDTVLINAQLAHAHLQNANFENANLGRAFLIYANLSNAFLAHTYLAESNLRNTNLAGAMLEHASLENANLEGANLTDANLKDVNLSRANLKNVVLARATLSNANLKDIKNWRTIQHLESANLDGIINPPPGFLEHVQRLKEMDQQNFRAFPCRDDIRN